MKIGLLGGSFNPAHDGHLYISVEAMKRAGLNQVWWLVSPGNPLKAGQEMAPFETRLGKAKKIAAHPRIRVSDCERHFETRYTIDTLKRLKQKYPQHRFVWLMGADNLAQFTRWKRWQEIAALVEIVVLDRHPYTQGALNSRAWQILTSGRKITPHGRGETALRQPKSFYFRQKAGLTFKSADFLRIPPHPASASILRKTLGKEAFF